MNETARGYVARPPLERLGGGGGWETGRTQVKEPVDTGQEGCTRWIQTGISGAPQPQPPVAVNPALSDSRLDFFLLTRTCLSRSFKRVFLRGNWPGNTRVVAAEHQEAGAIRGSPEPHHRRLKNTTHPRCIHPRGLSLYIQT